MCPERKSKHESWSFTPVIQSLWKKRWRGDERWAGESRFKIQDYFIISSEKWKRGWTLTTSQYTITHNLLYSKSHHVPVAHVYRLRLRRGRLQVHPFLRGPEVRMAAGRQEGHLARSLCPWGPRWLRGGPHWWLVWWWVELSPLPPSQSLPSAFKTAFKSLTSTNNTIMSAFKLCPTSTPLHPPPPPPSPPLHPPPPTSPPSRPHSSKGGWCFMSLLPHPPFTCLES